MFLAWGCFMFGLQYFLLTTVHLCGGHRSKHHLCCYFWRVCIQTTVSERVKLRVRLFNCAINTDGSPGAMLHVQLPVACGRWGRMASIVCVRCVKANLRQFICCFESRRRFPVHKHASISHFQNAKVSEFSRPQKFNLRARRRSGEINTPNSLPIRRPI